MNEEELQAEIRAVKAELYQTKAEVLEAYAVAASMEATENPQAEESNPNPNPNPVPDWRPLISHKWKT